MIGALLVLLALAAAAWWWMGREKKPEDVVVGIPDSFDELLAAAEKGNAVAAVRLGQMYAEGLEIEQDWLQSALWFRRAAERGSAEGKYQLGRLYEEGKGVERDWAKAARWFQNAAEQGYADAQWKIGLYYRDGKGGKTDPIWAKLWLEKAASQGQEEAKTALAQLVAGMKAAEDPVAADRQAAEAGDAEAQCRMGQRCFRGDGVEKDEAAGAEWYRKAAEQGDAEAECRWGDCLRKGRGVGQDAAKGVEWYRKAAEQGHAGSQYRLGECLRLGQGTEKNGKAAEAWFFAAAKQGHAGAQRAVGKYRMAAGNQKDSVAWLQKAANGGDAEGQYLLARCYQQGLGVGKNPALAKKWLQAAAENGYEAAQSAFKALEWSTGGLPGRARQGDRRAQYELGRKLMKSSNGKECAEGLAWLRKAALGGMPEAAIGLAEYFEENDPRESFLWWSRAADMGASEAQWRMVELCRRGRGTTPSDTEALRWMKKLAEEGNLRAMSLVADCYENGRGCGQDYAEAKRWYERAGDRVGAERMEQMISGRSGGVYWGRSSGGGIRHYEDLQGRTHVISGKK